MTSPLPLVVVVWDDAWVDGEATAGKASAALEHKPKVMTTIGWLLIDDESGVQISNEFYDDGYRGRTFIPRAMVRTMTTFRLAKPTTKKAKSNEHRTES